MLNKIVTPPRVAHAGSSNLALLSHIEVPADQIAPFESQRTISMDVQAWDVYEPESNRRVVGLMAHVEESRYRRSINYSWTWSSTYRQWTPISVLYAAPEDGSETPAPYKLTYPTTRDVRNEAIVPPVYDALVYLTAAFVTNGRPLDSDPLDAIRHLSAEEVSALAHWFAEDCEYKNEISDLRKLVVLWRAHIQRVLEGTAPSVVIGNREGAGRVRVLHGVVTAPHGITAEIATAEIAADVILDNGLYVPEVPLSLLIERDSDAWYCACLAQKMHPEVLRGLRRSTPDPEDTLSIVAPGVARELCDFLGSEYIYSGDALHRLLAGCRDVGEVPVVEFSGFSTNWVSSAISNIGWGDLPQQIRNALYYGYRIEVSAVDIEEFTRTSVPENDLVESVTMLQNGKVRVVLRELVYPTMVQRRGRIYIEDEPGTVLSDMSVAAFDLDFRGTLTRFPDATAYADPECTRTAKHTNITSAGGRVCLGDINTDMNRQEIEARGGIAIPCLADFLQMLRQCNLDSAYNRDKNFVLADPSSVTNEQWEAREWNIPGLRCVDVRFGDLINGNNGGN